MKVQTVYNDSVSNLSGFDMKVDGESNELLMYILSQGYSNPISSVVREYSTNAIDAHLEAGKMYEPIVINLTEDVFEVQDFGIGMDKDRITNVFCKFLGSTKRDTDKIHGGFGLGAKSGLAYRDNFMIYTVKDGYYHRLIMRKGSTSIRLETISEGYVDEPNGTKISIPLNSRHDKSRFKEAIEQQLAYFDNITFTESTGISNDFKIYEGKNFKISTLTHDIRPKILLGSVSYPMPEGSSVELSHHKITGWPIALKFNIGELKVTPYRESIIYDDPAIELIAEKFEAAKEEIKGYALEITKEPISDATEYAKYLIDYESKGVQLFGKDFAHISTPKRPYTGFKYITPDKFNKHSIYDLFDSRARSYYELSHINNGRRSKENVITYAKWRLIDKIRYDNLNIICTYTNTNWSTQRNKYLVRTFKQDIHIYSINKKLRLWKDLYEPLQLGEYPRSQWRDIINEYFEFERNIFNEIAFYENIHVPQDFIDSLKQERKKNAVGVKRTYSNSSIKIGRKGEIYPYFDVYDVKASVEDFYDYHKVRPHSRKGVIVHHDQKILKNFQFLFPRDNYSTLKSAFATGLVSKTVYKQMESSQFIIKYDDFVNNYSRHLSKLFTALIIMKWFLDVYRKIPHFNVLKFERNIAFYSKEVHDLDNKLTNYMKNHCQFYSSLSESRNFTCLGRLNKPYLAEIMNRMEENNWWDHAILQDLNRFKILLFDFLPVGQVYPNAQTEENCKFLIEYFKLKKFKLNKSFYNL